eukprot:m.404540 g.404540  ORF g.404540 m.404540 type:complete len:746 (-) comp20126_c0_seq12:2859-5096(-)
MTQLCPLSSGTMLVALVALGMLATTAHSAKKERLNVLYIVIDDLRPQLGAYQAEDAITPNFDRLARDSLLFDRAYSQVAVCGVSRQSFLTGRRPSSVRSWTTPSFRKVEKNLVTLPGHFLNNDYTVRGSGKVFHPNQPANWDAEKSWSKDFDYWPQNHHTVVRRRQFMTATTEPVRNYAERELYDYMCASKAIENIQRAKNEDKKFFIAVGFHLPHGPWLMPRQDWDQHRFPQLPRNGFRPHGTPEIAYSEELDSVTLNSGEKYFLGKQFSVDKSLPARAQREMRQGYAASITFMDRQLGRVLQELERQDLKNDTVIVIHSDHGYHLGEKSHWLKRTLFEADVRVPLLIHSPREMRKRGTRTKELVELVDVYPTLVELAGLPSPEQVDGSSLANLVRGGKHAKRFAAYSEFLRCPKDRSSPWKDNRCSNKPSVFSEKASYVTIGYSVRTQSWRYTAWMEYNVKQETTTWKAGPLFEELYDHHGDFNAADFDTYGMVNLGASAFLRSMKETMLFHIRRQYDKQYKVQFNLVKQHSGPGKRWSTARLKSVASFKKSGLLLRDCKTLCKRNPECRGVYYEKPTRKTKSLCTGLTQLGRAEDTLVPSSCWIKEAAVSKRGKLKTNKRKKKKLKEFDEGGEAQDTPADEDVGAIGGSDGADDSQDEGGVNPGDFAPATTTPVKKNKKNKNKKKTTPPQTQASLGSHWQPRPIFPEKICVHKEKVSQAAESQTHRTAVGLPCKQGCRAHRS